MAETITQSSLNICFLKGRDAMLEFFRPVLNKWSITEQQWRITRILAEEGQQDFHVLADKACLLRPSLTGILKRVEQMGIVSRRKPALDQRKVLLKLTPKGERLYRSIIVEMDAQYAILVQHLGFDEIKALRDLLVRLKAVSDEYHLVNFAA